MIRLTTALLAIAPLVVAAQTGPAEGEGVDATLERMQSMLHHAVETAAEGARLVALGDDGAGSAVDELAVKRGREMLAEARELIVEVGAGDAMMHLHTLELTEAQSAAMIETHRLEQAATAYLNVTEQILADDDAPEAP